MLFTKAYTSSNFLFHSWQTSIASEAVLCLLILTPSLPYLKPFLDSFESGMFRNDGIRQSIQNEAKHRRPSFSLRKPSKSGIASESSQGRNQPDSRLMAGAVTELEVIHTQQLRQLSSGVDSNTNQSQITKNTSVSWSYEYQNVEG